MPVTTEVGLSAESSGRTDPSASSTTFAYRSLVIYKETDDSRFNLRHQPRQTNPRGIQELAKLT